ncbi:cellulase family glycosylhydrolase, partial [Roseateles sp.]|uniref:cellulase family glycosylhydrolase n=1 Tax=Roseateles sp. TaxID=1971397 RepID=UPI002DFD2340
MSRKNFWTLALASLAAALVAAGCGGGGGGSGAGADAPGTSPGPGPSSPPASASVTAVSAMTADFSAAASPRMNERAYYRVTGSNLPGTLALDVADCARMTAISISGTEARFQCMPSFTEGAKAISVKAAAADAAALFSGSVTVQAATAPLPMPTYGFNLGNTFEATWGYPDPTQAVFTNAAKAGFNAVRIPCAWDFNSDKTTGQINAAYLAKVKQSVDWALAAGMH